MNHNKLNLKAKVLLGILILLCMVAFFYVLHIRFLGKSPCNQVGTSWRTSDGRITFSVVETDPAEDKNAASLGHVASSDDGKWVHGFGKAELSNNNTVEIVFVDGIKGQVNISYATQNIGENRIIVDERGSLICLSSNWCVVRLRESSELLGGKIISFYKMND